MGGYSKQASAGLIALLAIRRARAEHDRRLALSASGAGEAEKAGAGAEPAVKKTKKRGWFG